MGGRYIVRVTICRLILLGLFFPTLSGCWYAAAAGAGAAVAYYASEEGYKVQSPVTHDIPDKQQNKEKE
jgi:hypothetical protein